MESSESFIPDQTVPTRKPRSTWAGLIKAIIGVGLLALLVYWGQIDLRSLATLAETPSTVLISFALMYTTLPLGAWRWAILLRTFGLPLSYGRAFHFTAIGALGNMFLLGSVGGDALRLFYAWRSLGHGAGRIAVSILADRALGLFALIAIAAVISLLNWHQLQQVPALALLAFSVLLVFAAAVGGGLAFLIAPALVLALSERLSRWPRIARRIRQVHDLALMARRNPMSLLAALALALVVQISTVLVIVLIAQALRIGSLDPADYIFAAPLTLIANALPLTPNGLGVGEVAFDQICRWLEPHASGAAYSSIFFAFRALGVMVSVTGLVSFVIYRVPPRRDAA